MGVSTLVFLFALTACDGPPRSSVDWKDIIQLESIVRVPADPGSKTTPLAKYRRYYTGVVIHGRHMISGEYVLSFSADQKPGVYPVGREQDFPGISDGGCSVVHLLYDIATKRIAYIGCNGYA